MVASADRRARGDRPEGAPGGARPSPGVLPAAARAVGRAGRAALGIGRLAAREHAPAYAALGAIVAVLAAGGALAASSAADAGARPRIALGYALAATELAAVVGAALAAATGLARELASGRAATLLVRPVGALGYLAGRLLGAVAVGAAVTAAGLAGGLLAIAVGAGPGALEGLAPRAEFSPLSSASSIPLDSGGAPLSWPFEVPTRLRSAGRVSLRIQPRLQFLAASEFPVPVAVRVRVTAFADDRALAPVEIDVPTLEPGEGVLPAELTAAREARLELELATPGAIVRLGPGSIALRGPPGSLLAGAAAAGLGIALEAAFVAALAVLGATFLSDWVATGFALGLALAARAPELLHGFAAGIAEGAPAHEHGSAAAVAAAQPPGAFVRAVQVALDALAASLPDLGRLDFATPLLAGRATPLEAVARAAPSPLPWIAAALLLAALVLARREVGLSREADR